ncbi:hypothetical protein SOVF_096420, partial [Spinacia oleracea]
LLVDKRPANINDDSKAPAPAIAHAQYMEDKSKGRNYHYYDYLQQSEEADQNTSRNIHL